MVLVEELPPVADSLHDLGHGQEGELAPDDLPELLAEVNVGRQRLLRLVFHGLVLLTEHVLHNRILGAAVVGGLVRRLLALHPLHHLHGPSLERHLLPLLQHRVVLLLLYDVHVLLLGDIRNILDLLDPWVLVVHLLIMLRDILGHVSHGNLALLGRDRTVLLAYLFDLVIEGPLLLEIPDLVPVGLVFEVLALLGGHGQDQGLNVGEFTDFLHNLERAHFRVGVNYLGSRLWVLLRVWRGKIPL